MSPFSLAELYQDAVNARISRMVYRSPYRIDPIAMEFLNKVGIEVVEFIE